MLSFTNFDELSPYDLEGLLESSKSLYFDSLTGSWVRKSYSDEQPETVTEIAANDSIFRDAFSLTTFSESEDASLTSQWMNLRSFNVSNLIEKITQTISDSVQTEWVAVNTASDAATEYNIELIFIDNNLTNSQQALFVEAANRWEQIIVGDVPDVFVNGSLIDDIAIEISAPFIDGVDGILGQAGPTAVRSDSFLPYAGIIELDSADVAQLESDGQLDEVILHEMAHVIGFGAIWQALGLLSGAFGLSPRFVGEQAVEEYNNTFGLNGTSVPVENGGGPGTRNGHWEESVFDNELMTGFLNEGQDNPISSITVASMGDLGYDVNLGAADPYIPPNAIAQGSDVFASEPTIMGTESNLGVMSQSIVV